MSESALECSLALMRAPHLGDVLRARPVPGDIGAVIEIASGSSAAADTAAAATGESPARLLEAARFYVQQVLLHPEADAWRVLGVQPGASEEQIRRHYRALQRWLHPDRTDAWESVFASRVNQARSRLRERAGGVGDPQARVGVAAGRAVTGAGAGAGAWRVVPVEQGVRIHPALPVGAVLALCGWLAWQVVQRTDSDLGRAQAEPLDFADSDRASVSPTTATAPAAPVRVGAAAPRAVDAAPPADVVAGTGSPAVRLALPAFAGVPPVATAPHPHAPSDMRASLRDAAAVALAPPAPSDAVEPASESDAWHGPDAQGLPGIDPIAYALAQQCSETLLAYLADPDAASPPIWSSVAVMDAASELRAELSENTTGRLSWASPQWRLSPRRAEVTVALVSRHRLARRPAGQVHGAMRWRDGNWRVEHVAWTRP